MCAQLLLASTTPASHTALGPSHTRDLACDATLQGQATTYALCAPFPRFEPTMARLAPLVVVLAAVLAATATALPDLILDESRLVSSITIATSYFGTSSCAYQEGCVTGTGQRRLLRFDTATPNIGTTDLHLGAPSANFEYDPCHGHWHYKGYAEYRMFDGSNNEVGWCACVPVPLSRLTHAARCR